MNPKTQTIEINASELPSECKRQESEGAKAYHAFCVYLSLGPARTQAKVLDIVGSGAISTASVKYRWKERAAAYDEWLQGQMLAMHSKSEIEKMLERHSEQAGKALKVVDKLTTKLLDKIEEGGEFYDHNGNNLLPDYALKSIALIPKLQESEASAKGLTPTKRLELTGQGGEEIKHRFLEPIVVSSAPPAASTSPDMPAEAVVVSSTSTEEEDEW